MKSFTLPCSAEFICKPDTIAWAKVVEEATDKIDKDGNEILKVTEKKSAVYTWDGVNEKITGSNATVIHLYNNCLKAPDDAVGAFFVLLTIIF